MGAERDWGMGEREERRQGQRPVNAVIPRYEQRTDNVIVRVEPEFLAEQSSPKDSRFIWAYTCLLYTSPSPRDGLLSRMPSSA